MDRQFGERHPNTTCGTTATAAVLYGQTLWLAHVGDSRAVLGTRGGAVTALTKDHKPDDAFEENRIRVRTQTRKHENTKTRTTYEQRTPGTHVAPATRAEPPAWALRAREHEASAVCLPAYTAPRPARAEPPAVRRAPTPAAALQEKGGSVTREDVARVEGVLAVTRAFGNNAMKAVITAEPEVLAHRLSPQDEFLIIASDGVWDLLSNADAVRRPRLWGA